MKGCGLSPCGSQRHCSSRSIQTRASGGVRVSHATTRDSARKRFTNVAHFFTILTGHYVYLSHRPLECPNTGGHGPAAGGKAAHSSLEETKIRDAPPCVVAPTDAHDHCRPHGWCLGLPPVSQGRGGVVSDKPWEAPFLSGRSSVAERLIQEPSSASSSTRPPRHYAILSAQGGAPWGA